MFLAKKRYKSKKIHMKIMFWALKRWYLRKKFNKFLAYHKGKKRFTTRAEIKFCGAIRKI